MSKNIKVPVYRVFQPLSLRLIVGYTVYESHCLIVPECLMPYVNQLYLVSQYINDDTEQYEYDIIYHNPPKITPYPVEIYLQCKSKKEYAKLKLKL